VFRVRGVLACFVVSCVSCELAFLEVAFVVTSSNAKTNPNHNHKRQTHSRPALGFGRSVTSQRVRFALYDTSPSCLIFSFLVCS
jgi:hypothetical protein